MRKARTKVTGRVDCIAGSCAEREADAPDEATHQVGTDARCGPRGQNKLRCDAACDDDQNEGGDDLADQVPQPVADGGRGAEDRPLCVFVFRDRPMRAVMDPH